MTKFSIASFAQTIPAHHRGTAAFILVVLGSLAIQSSTALLSHLYTDFSPLSVAGLRMGAAALILALLVRPNPLALKKTDWPQVLIYSVVVCLMTTGYFQAIKYRRWELSSPLNIWVPSEYPSWVFDDYAMACSPSAPW